MLINMPEELLPYVTYDREKTLVHSEDMPEELKSAFDAFLVRVKAINEKKKEMLGGE